MITARVCSRVLLPECAIVVVVIAFCDTFRLAQSLASLTVSGSLHLINIGSTLKGCTRESERISACEVDARKEEEKDEDVAGLCVHRFASMHELQQAHLLAFLQNL